MRRCPNLLAVFTALVSVAAWSGLARADGITTPGTVTYSFSIPGGLPDPGTDVKHVNPGMTIPQVEAQVVPPGSIIPPVGSDGKTESPLTILPDSYGFDLNRLGVLLNNYPQTGTPTDQKLGLAFFNGGLAPKNFLHFSLNIDKSLTTPPTLEIISPPSPNGILITPDVTKTTTSAVSPSPVNTPEPLPVLVWSVLAGLGLVRVRALRRSRPRLPA